MCFNQIVAIHFHFVPLCALIKVFPGKNGSYINNILKGTMSRPEFPNIFHSSYKKMSLKVTPLTRTWTGQCFRKPMRFTVTSNLINANRTGQLIVQPIAQSKALFHRIKYRLFNNLHAKLESEFHWADLVNQNLLKKGNCNQKLCRINFFL